MTNTTIDREVETRLQENDVRYTKGRRLVVSELGRADGPLSATELHATMQNTPLSSIYRSLSVLEEAGVLVHHFGQKGVTRYELAEWLTGHHHHLVCVNCGAVDDVELSGEMELRVDGLVEAIASRVGFHPTDHTLEIEGHCSRCA